MLLHHSALWKTVRWYKKVEIHIMETLLSNAYYIYAKNAIKPMAMNMKDLWESIATNLIGPVPPHCHLSHKYSFTNSPLYHQQKNKNTARASKHVVKTKSIRKRDNVYFVPINQHFALIRVYVSFIKTLVSSKKNYHLVLMINILLSNHIFCLESLVSSNNVFRKRTYNHIPFIAIFVLYTLITTYIVIKNFEPPVYKSQAT